MTDDSNLTVVVTAGVEDGGVKASQATTLALTAMAMEKTVTLFGFLSASQWAFTKGAKGIRAPGYPPLTELFQIFEAEGGRMLVCSSCVREYCFVAGFENARPDLGGLQPWARMAGLATLAGLAMRSQMVVV
jgi:predicted peroxiredoxin